jgi:hypothetical protein
MLEELPKIKAGKALTTKDTKERKGVLEDVNRELETIS